MIFGIYNERFTTRDYHFYYDDMKSMKAKTTKKIMLRSECKGKGCNVKKQVTIKRTKRFELEEKKKVLGGYWYEKTQSKDRESEGLSERGVAEWRVLPYGKEFTDNDYGIRRVITVAEFSDEDEMHYAWSETVLRSNLFLRLFRA